MYYLNKSYNCSKNFKFFFDLHFRFCLLYLKGRTFVLKLPSIFFFKFTNTKFSLLFINYFYFISFIKFIFKFYSKYFIYYYFKLKLKGLGYRTRKLSKKLYRIYFNRSNYYYLHIPRLVLLKYRTRRFFFISLDKGILKKLILNLLLLKERIIYRFSGIIYPYQIFLMKPGKNKFR